MVMRRLGEAEKGVCERHHASRFWWRSRAHGENPDWFEIPKTGAANRIRTCDPVITNDVLYQLSYCGGPCGAFSNTLRTPAPDIGHATILQEKRGHTTGKKRPPRPQKLGYWRETLAQPPQRDRKPRQPPALPCGGLICSANSSATAS